MHNPEFLMVLGEYFVPAEVQQIVAFMERGFSPNGEVVVVSVFLFAKEHGKQLADVFAACEVEWKRNWNFQHPDLRGDPDAPGSAGAQNRASLHNIYQTLGVPNPYEEGKKIPKKPLVVETSNSTYRIGQANRSGRRTIARDRRPLPFARCKIIFLAKKKPMSLIPVDYGSGEPWHTSNVVSITIG